VLKDERAEEGKIQVTKSNVFFNELYLGKLWHPMLIVSADGGGVDLRGTGLQERPIKELWQ
jgi:hypothetical protein